MSGPSSARSPSASPRWRRRCSPSSASARSPPPRSSPRPPTSAASSRKDAFARHNGTAPLPVWSGNHERHRLSRTGNRQLNAAIHRIAITQARCHPDAVAYLDRPSRPRQHPHRSAPRPQATPLRRRLPSPPRRRRARTRPASARSRLAPGGQPCALAVDVDPTQRSMISERDAGRRSPRRRCGAGCPCRPGTRR